MIDIIVVGIIIICLGSIVYYYRKKRKAGESISCSCGCNDCASKGCSGH